MSNTTKHTPGPWIISEDGNRICYRNPIVGISAFLRHEKFLDGFEREQAANMALISAAPDLLACMLPKMEFAPDPLSAISAVVAEFETLREKATEAGIEFVDPSATWDCVSEVKTFLKEARAAIKKATAQ